MVAKKHLKCIGQYLVAYHINMSVCMSYLEWSAHRDCHHLITSSNQLVNSDGHLIFPPVDKIPPWLQPQSVMFSGEELSDPTNIIKNHRFIFLYMM